MTLSLSYWMIFIITYQKSFILMTTNYCCPLNQQINKHFRLSHIFIFTVFYIFDIHIPMYLWLNIDRDSDMVKLTNTRIKDALNCYLVTPFPFSESRTCANKKLLSFDTDYRAQRRPLTACTTRSKLPCKTCKSLHTYTYICILYTTIYCQRIK